MANNKVQLADGTVLMDISDTTATESDVLQGKTLYAANGAKVTGSLGTATASTDGLMSAEDKIKLDGIENNATENRTNKSIGRFAVVSFSDGADQLPMAVTVDIEPVQDLNGYEYPWPAGGGKNLYNDSLAQGSIRTSDGTTTSNTTRVRTVNGIVLKAGTYTISCFGAYKGNAFFYTTSDVFIEPLDSSNMSVLPYTFTLQSETLCRFVFTLADDGNIKPTDVTSIQIESGSSATDYSPYSNICPISGWTGAKITRTGKNLWDEDSEAGYISNGGNNGDAEGFIRSKNYISVLPSTEYYFLIPGSYRVFYYKADKTFISYKGTYSSARSLTTPSDCRYVRFYTNQSAYGNNISINYPATETQYHPGNVQQIEIKFPSSAGTVYGGTLTVNKDGTGTLVVDRASKTFDGTETWTRANGGAANAFFTTVISNQNCASAEESISNIYSNADVKSATTVIGFKTVNDGTNLLVRVRPNDASNLTVDSFVESITNENLQILYYIAEPITYQLTALEVIETLKGINNIYADTGDILSVYYQTTAASDIVDVMKPQISSLLNAIFPIGTIYTTASSSAPTFGEGWTWQEIVVPLTWNDLKTGDRHAYSGTSTGGFHYWKRIA